MIQKLLNFNKTNCLRYFFFILAILLVVSSVFVRFSFLKHNCKNWYFSKINGRNHIVFVGKLNQIFNVFALQNNLKHLLTTKPDTGEIRAVHGIRFMSALGLIMSHKAMALFYNPYINRTNMVEVMLSQQKLRAL